MLRLEDSDFRLAKQVVSVFTIVCSPPVRQPGDNQFLQVDYRTTKKTALKAGKIGVDEIVIVDGQILLRQDALTKTFNSSRNYSTYPRNRKGY